jgi:dUTP pyrophosphatase
MSSASANRYNWFTDCENAKQIVLHATLTDAKARELYGERANYGSDSGFDLYVPTDITVQPGETATIDHAIVCEPQFPGGYYLYPRSSISKTPLRLANSVGIIDSGYRGSIMAKVDNRGTEPYTVKRGERLFQLCHPSLLPLTVRLVDAVNTATERGAGGFGSTTK